MNRKGFTLIELLATILILAIVVGISSYSIISLIKRSKESNYNLLIGHIKDASELYYQECKYANNSGITCTEDGKTTLGDLVSYGYLKGNGTVKSNNNKNGNYTIVNPMNNENISACQIQITYENGNIEVTSISTNKSCPTTDEYSNALMDDEK